MDFIIENLKENIVGIARNLGYQIIDTNNNEYNLVRKLGGGGNYPRFHAYVTQRGTDFNFSLHLDQKAPVYGGGSHAHNGEYFGPVVETEADRIKQLLVVSE